MGILQSLPDSSQLATIGSGATQDVGTLLSSLGRLAEGGTDSPLGSVVQALQSLTTHLDIDVSGLTEQLPQAITVIQNALPADTLEYVEDLQTAYDTARQFLAESAIAEQIQAGGDLQAAALAVVADALRLFDGRLTQLTTQLLPSDALTQVEAVFAQLEAFQAAVPTQPEALLPFLTDNLIGVAPDLLAVPLSQVNAVYALVGPLSQPEPVEAAQAVIATHFASVLATLNDFDATDTAAYTQLQTQLTALETALDQQVTAITALYDAVETQITEFDDTALLTLYRQSLEAITLPPVFSPAQAINSVVAVLEELMGRLHLSLGVDDLTDRVNHLSDTIRQTFLNSGLGQIRQTLRGYLEEIQGAIENIPTEVIQATVVGMLERVRQELDHLGITQIEAQITAAFTAAETFVTDTFNEGLQGTVRTALAQLLSEIRSLPVADLINELTRILDELNRLILEFKAALSGYMEEFRTFVAQLDQLSFKPLSDEVVQEIEALKARLAAMDPTALSDIEKLALKAALVVLEELDLDAQVVTLLNQGFGEAQTQVRGLLGDLTGLLNRLRDQVNNVNPQTLLKPLYDLLDQGVAQVNRLNANLLMGPLYTQLEEQAARLQTLSPGQLLDPLQSPYDQMLQVVNRLNPDQWVAPLHDLYAYIDQLISYVDITPLMEQLETQRQELFAKAREAILSGLDAVNLPAPLDQFWAAIRTVLGGFTDAIFGDPETELRQLSIEVRSQFRLSSLFTPLDAVFDRLIGLLDQVPQTPLVDTLNAIREGIGIALHSLDPMVVQQRLRQGQQWLESLNPAGRFSTTLQLPQVQAQFTLQVAGAPAGQAAAITTLTAQITTLAGEFGLGRAGSPLSRLAQRHQQLMTTLRHKINGLNLDAVKPAYARLKDSLEQRLPDFLRLPTPLTYGDVKAGLASLRPAALTQRLDRAVDRFLQQLAPLEAALEPAVNGFFAGLRDTLMLINPLTLKDAVADIYATVRSKVRILDPTALADAIRTNALEPLLSPLEAINPTAIKARLDHLFSIMVNTVKTGVKTLLDDIAQVVDQQLQDIRTAIVTLIEGVEGSIDTATQTIQAIIAEVEQLIFVELLERLNRVIDNLGVSFDAETRRVVNAFEAMLNAAPV
ncbi:MAG: hypothetical protein ACHWZW_20870 [Spirulina sp.]